MKPKRRDCQVHDHSELWRTRRCVPESGFLTTIQNMIDVAKLNAYLSNISRSFSVRNEFSPCENVLCVVVPQINRRRPSNGYALRLALIIREQIRCCPR